jgi:light-regulated signal transduction histidine kinase (bacteriophytochrome)
MDVLLAECEKEPIHIPGAIQPFGLFLTINPTNWLIQNISENCLLFCGMSPETMLEKSFADFIFPSDRAALKDYFAKLEFKEQSPLPIQLSFDENATYQEWELGAHENGEALYLELIKATAEHRQESSLAFHRKIRDSLQALHRSKSLQELCNITVDEIREMTGFDRVMIYRFHPDWSGEVISEACREGVDSYLGHHFPSSDIPSQARAIFLQNWLRMIPDAAYALARIIPGKHPQTGKPLDLSRSMLRSVSPIHLEYLRNMNVAASLTVSLIDDGKLWGLIACHHASPLLVDTDGRIGAQLIGQVASSQLRTKTTLDELDYRERLRQIRRQMVGSLTAADNFTETLAKGVEGLLEITSAHGAAVKKGNGWTLIGKTPTIPQIEQLAAWLSSHPDLPDTFHTDSLLREFPRAADHKEIASGLLAIAIARSEQNYIMWFRPEVVSTITWAGNPEKSVKQSGTRITLHPRESFNSWKEIVSGKAIPWQKPEIEAAESLRVNMLSLALQCELTKEQKARKRAERLSREKEEMVMMVSHDLRTPLNVASLSLEFLQRAELSDEPVVQRMLDRGVQATTNMEELITSILDVAKIEAGTLDIELKEETASELVHDVVSFYTPIAQEKDISLEAQIEIASCTICCEKNRIMQVLNNLVSNAIKFTPHGGKVAISLKEVNGEALFSVSDTGDGIPPESLDKIFDRFWQAQNTKRQGTGLGLAIAKGIIEKHNGNIWAQSRLGSGSDFHFTLPEPKKK